MAAAYSLTSSLFPNGTTVYANAVGEDDAPVSAVVTGGTATFTGLRELHEYVAHATIGTPDIDGAGITRVQTSFKTSGGSSASRVLLYDEAAETYLPAEYQTDTSQPREFVGPVDPDTIEGITLAYGDRWTPTEEPAV